MRNWLFAIVLGAQCLNVAGQKCLSDFIDSVDSKLRPITMGSYHANFSFVSSGISNVIAYNGFCYYDKSCATPGAVAEFILFIDDTIPYCAYWDKHLYKFDGSKKEYTSQFLRPSHFAEQFAGDFRNYLAINAVIYNVQYPIDDDLRVTADSAFCDMAHAGYMRMDTFYKGKEVEPIKRYHTMRRSVGSDTLEISTAVKWVDAYQTMQWKIDSLTSLTANDTLSKMLQRYTKICKQVAVKEIDNPALVDRVNPGRGEVLSLDTVPITNLYNFNGTKFRLSAINNRLVLIDFWYITSELSMAMMPDVQKLSNDYRDKGLSVIGVDAYDLYNDSIIAALKRVNVTYPVYMDNDHKLVEALGIYRYPTVVLFDPYSRKILYYQVAMSDVDAVRKAIEAHLKP